MEPPAATPQAFAALSHAAPTPKPSSVAPLQSSSTPLQASVAPGCTLASPSSQSSPPSPIAMYPSPSESWPLHDGSGPWVQPDDASQVSTVHGSASSQAESSGVFAQPLTASQVSTVHATASLQSTLVAEQPVAGSHVPATRHASPLPQSTGTPPVHTPPCQCSPVVQRLPSLHAVPSAGAGQSFGQPR